MGIVLREHLKLEQPKMVSRSLQEIADKSFVESYKGAESFATKENVSRRDVPLAYFVIQKNAYGRIVKEAERKYNENPVWDLGSMDVGRMTPEEFRDAIVARRNNTDKSSIVAQLNKKLQFYLDHLERVLSLGCVHSSFAGDIDFYIDRHEVTDEAADPNQARQALLIDNHANLKVVDGRIVETDSNREVSENKLYLRATGHQSGDGLAGNDPVFNMLPDIQLAKPEYNAEFMWEIKKRKMNRQVYDELAKHAGIVLDENQWDLTVSNPVEQRPRIMYGDSKEHQTEMEKLLERFSK